MKFVLLLLASLIYQEPVNPPVKPDQPPVVLPKKILPILPKVETPTPAPVQPSVDPSPTFDPLAPTHLPDDRLYVLESSVKFKLFASDVKLVHIKKMQVGTDGKDFFAKFVDGPDEEVERTYKGPYLAVIRAAKKTDGIVKLIYDPEGSEDESSATEIFIKVGTAPRPPPKPDDPVVPDPDTPPDPDLQTFKSLIQATTAKFALLPAADKPKLAAAFREAAIKIDSGTVENMQQMTKVTADLMVEKLGLNAVLLWVPWRDEVTKVLKTQSLTTAKDHVGPWNTIADVLEGK